MPRTPPVKKYANDQDVVIKQYADQDTMLNIPVRSYANQKAATARQYMDEEATTAKQYALEQAIIARQYTNEQDAAIRNYVDEKITAATYAYKKDTMLSTAFRSYADQMFPATRQ